MSSAGRRLLTWRTSTEPAPAESREVLARRWAELPDGAADNATASSTANR